ncbi:protein DEFECTIVE IN MERISTEM SILENCING 3 isoform X2 [Elaeis guineensis]|uniref:Protein DEFECTIVE IN MERISTEM SILENCING 3 isoform X2 n=1 Tax=Elaeis guineensis var. tenera TaxID=51953 RepID=A0A6I9R0C9_ELAGV|nr:protein DEFECTIVE IN MERISTEM SILENCING 3 isoform X2 [Elaeis guineensis]
MLDGEMHDGELHNVEIVKNHTQKLQDDLQKLALKVKHHEDNMKFLKTQMDNIDESILDMQVNLGKYHSSSAALEQSNDVSAIQSEQQTVGKILQQVKTAAGIICQMKIRHGFQASKLQLTKDVLGIVATLGKVNDDNLSRLFSEYLGLETMLAIVCKTYEGVKALEKYDREGMIDKNAGLHGLGPSIGRLLNGRFLVFCLENLRKDVEVKFLISPGISKPANVIEIEEKLKLMSWQKERLAEDVQREEALLNQAKNLFNIQKQEFVKYLSETASHIKQAQSMAGRTGTL